MRGVRGQELGVRGQGLAPEPPKGDKPQKWVFMRKIVLMRI